ncbi:MAG: tannase/feruloyl esterase family alpha/beta hydrolase, partial [Rhodospirillales bacterium]
MTDRDLHIEPERKPKPRRADARTLRQAALSYLQRYQSSKANLRRVLRQRLDRALLAYGPERTAGPEDIEVILDECETAGLIDDSRYCAIDVPADVPACAAGQDNDSCLTPAQAEAIQKVYDGPRTSDDHQIFPGFEPG